jgi:RNA polymerase sigma factor (sigma-70 family)
MMTTKLMSLAVNKDAELVSASLSGNRDAFGQIVARYQSLVCSLAFSATGNLSQSEDLAQETFVTAWKQLAGLREPEKLRAWLCGIARNLINHSLHKQGREPSHQAKTLEEISESHSPNPLPTEQAISNEELAILWRSLERIPEIYREPLVLFYREQQSVERVAEALELSEDAVHQRLSRGRRLLQEQFLAFVEGALKQTTPGKTFTLAVLASLPGLAISAKAATVGAAAKSSATAKAAGAMGLLGAFFGPLIVFVPNYIGYRLGLAGTQSDEERGYIKAFFRKAGIITLGLFLPIAVVVLWLSRNQSDRSYLSGLLAAILTLIYLPTIVAFAIASKRKSREYHARILAQEYAGIFPKPAWEYRSKLTLFGLPLVHIRIGDRFSLLKKPVTAWIAVANKAVGGLFAFGAMAIAPLSIGGLSIGFLSLGGLSIGIFALGAVALGVWALFGGLVIGWQAVGCFAFAWKAAAGDFALAHDFALGRIACAAQANNDIAKQFIEPNLFFRCAQFINQHWLWINLFWIVPFFVQWLVIACKRRSQERCN